MLTLLFQQNPPKKTHPPVEVENGSLEDQFYLPNGNFPLLWLLDKEYPLKSNILPFQRHFWVDICFSNSLLVGYLEGMFYVSLVDSKSRFGTRIDSYQNRPLKRRTAKAKMSGFQ